MSIETQTPQIKVETQERTVTSVGQEAYASLSDVIKRALLENKITGPKPDQLRFRDDTSGIDVLVHGDTPVSGSKIAPAILLDNLRTDDPDGDKRIVIQSNGTLSVDGRTIFTLPEAVEKAAFAEFVTTLPRVPYE